MTTKYAIYFNGELIGTRTSKSARVYSHAVVIRRSYEGALAKAQAKSWDEHDRRDYRYFRAVAEGTHPHANHSWRSDRERARDAHILAITEDEYVAQQLKARLDEIEAAKAAGDYDRYSVESYAGRRDLAEKAAQPYRANAYIAEVHIVNAMRTQ